MDKGFSIRTRISALFSRSAWLVSTFLPSCFCVAPFSDWCALLFYEDFMFKSFLLLRLSFSRKLCIVLFSKLNASLDFHGAACVFHVSVFPTWIMPWFIFITGNHPSWDPVWFISIPQRPNDTHCFTWRQCYRQICLTHTKWQCCLGVSVDWVVWCLVRKGCRDLYHSEISLSKRCSS